jgi:hypothetical protein
MIARNDGNVVFVQGGIAKGVFKKLRKKGVLNKGVIEARNQTLILAKRSQNANAAHLVTLVADGVKDRGDERERLLKDGG